MKRKQTFLGSHIQRKKPISDKHYENKFVCVITHQLPISKAEEEVPDNELDDNVDVEYNVNTNKISQFGIFSHSFFHIFILT